MTSFKVIIVGGSIAGLTLANILERYGIDYIVLEKHDEIAPQLGASLGLLPHGARILDQLGINDKLKTHAVQVQYICHFGPDGHQIQDAEKFGDLMDELSVKLIPSKVVELTMFGVDLDIAYGLWIGSTCYGPCTITYRINPRSILPWRF